MRDEPPRGEDAPPPIPPAEMPAEELRALVDAGDLEGVSHALESRAVRLPAVLRELDRVLAAGLGNLGAAIATLLIARFHVSQANALADRVLEQVAHAGTDELADLAAALMQQERLLAAARVIDAALAREATHDRAKYLRARLWARRGEVARAFETIARVSPKLLGASGLAAQARFAAFAGQDAAARKALALARKADPDEPALEHAAQVLHRVETIGLDGLELRRALALEYGAILIERAATEDGRFGPEPITPADVGRLIGKLARAMSEVAPASGELLFATEDGEVVASGLGKLLDRPVRRWRKERRALDGDWLVMGSASTHPHLPHDDVSALDRALAEGTLRSLAVIMPYGWRGALVPDLIGRLTLDDEMPWAIDDEIEEVYAAITAEAPSEGLVGDDEDAAIREIARCRNLLRAAGELPRSGHVPFEDEMPIRRSS